MALGVDRKQMLSSQRIRGVARPYLSSWSGSSSKQGRLSTARAHGGLVAPQKTLQNVRACCCDSTRN